MASSALVPKKNCPWAEIRDEPGSQKLEGRMSHFVRHTKIVRIEEVFRYNRSPVNGARRAKPKLVRRSHGRDESRWSWPHAGRVRK